MNALLASASSATQQVSSASASVAVAAQSSQTAGLADWIKPFTPDSIANGFSILLGALIGSMLAYALQRKFQKSIEHKNGLISGHRLMFALLQQINTIVLIQRDYVYKEIDNHGWFLSIPATPPFDTSKNVLQLPELTFLIGTKEGRNILYDFYLAQENYVEAIRQWNIRSTLHVERVQPALATSGLVSGSAITQEMLQKALGAHILGSIINSTDNCIKTLRRAFQGLAAVKTKARAYLVARFETEDFTDFDFPDTYGLNAEQNSGESKSET